MPNLKITQLDPVSSPDDTDIFESVQDVPTTPVNKKITWTLIKSFLKTYFDTLYSAIGGGGQTLYDIIVAPSGGDYTSLSQALNNALEGQTIFVRSGIYEETEIVDFYNYESNINIIGENKKDTIIYWPSTTYNICLSTGVKNPSFFNLTFKSNVSGSTIINGSGGGFIFNNCIFNASSSGVSMWMNLTSNTSDFKSIKGCYFIGSPYNASYSLNITAYYLLFENNFFYTSTADNSTLINCAGSYCSILNNIIYSNRRNVINLGGQYQTLVGNIIYSSDSAGSRSILIISGDGCTISSNEILSLKDMVSSAYYPVYITGSRNILNSNRIGRTSNATYNTGIYVINMSGSYNSLTGNVVGKVSSGNHINDTGTGNSDVGNVKL